MTILHKLSKDDIEAVVGEKVANEIIASREGKIKTVLILRLLNRHYV